MKKLILFGLLIGMVLSGCGTVNLEGEVLNPTAAVAQNIITPQLTAETGPEATPLIEGFLPAPVIFMGSKDEQPVAPGKQNLYRLEMDGETVSQLTDEAAPVTSFAVSPVDGAIAYTTFPENDLYRINADGSGRTLLIDGPDLSTNPGPDAIGSELANVAWSPDGKLIAYGQDGINIVAAAGGQPQRIVANWVFMENEQVSQESRFFYPLEWSPDGKRILALEGYGVEGSGFATVRLADGGVNDLGGGVYCCDPTWSEDGSSYYLSSSAYGMLEPGLWRVDLGSNEPVALVDGIEGEVVDPASTILNLFLSAQQLEDGQLYAFAASGTFDQLYLDENRSQIIPSLQMSRMAPDGSGLTALREEAYAATGVLWANDGSGAVITVYPDEEYPPGTLLWLAADGSDPIVLGGNGSHPRWGLGRPSSGSPGSPEYGAQLSPEYAGLTYRTEDGLWLVGSDGRSRKISLYAEAALSPDGTAAVYELGENGDLWIEDLLSGEIRNLTGTPDRREGQPQWWIARPDVIAFGSKMTDEPLVGFGQPTLIHRDGTGYQVLDGSGKFSLSPDGEKIAFGCCMETGWMFSWPNSLDPFDPGNFGTSVNKLFTPTFSPDGSKLAWKASGEFGGSDFDSAYVIFDLETETSRVLHPFTPLAGSEVPEYFAWSPDSEWVAFVTYAERAELGRGPALWVSRVDGSEEHLIGEGFNPVWSPDGSRLIYNTTGEVVSSIYDQTIWFVETGSWSSPEELVVPGELVNWIEN